MRKQQGNPPQNRHRLYLVYRIHSLSLEVQSHLNWTTAGARLTLRDSLAAGVRERERHCDGEEEGPTINIHASRGTQI